MSGMLNRSGRPFTPLFLTIAEMQAGESRLLKGVSLSSVHNLSKSLRKYGRPVKMRSTSLGVRVQRIEISDVVPLPMPAKAAPKANSERRASHLKGTALDRETGRWRAQIRIDGRQVHLGRFATAQDAHQAYLRAEQEKSRTTNG